jgi:outer membrane immunogenic protein
MRHIVALLIASAGLALPQAAFAADMPLKAPLKAPPAVVYNWAGLYIGGHFGGGWDAQDHTRLVANNNYPAGFTSSDTLSGTLGGVQGGANYQFSQYLIGVEGDFSWSHLTDTDTVLSPCPAGAGCIDPKIKAGRFSTFNRQLDQLSDITGRLGLVFDQFLVYGKGGVAWARTGGLTSSTFNADGTLRTTSLHSADTTPGWIIAGGVEWNPRINWMMLPGNVTFKIEYDYIRLNTNSSGCSTEIGGPNATIGLVTCGDSSTNNTVQVVKGGVNLLFHPWGGGG